MQWYGEVQTYDTVKRSAIAELQSTADELCYRFNVGEWKKLTRPIKVKEYAPRKLWYTNLFLLQHAIEVPELTIKSEAAYRLHVELKRRLASITINDDEHEQAFEVGDAKIILADGHISAICSGRTVASISISDFQRSMNSQLKILMQNIEHSTMGGEN